MSCHMRSLAISSRRKFSYYSAFSHDLPFWEDMEIVRERILYSKRTHSRVKNGRNEEIERERILYSKRTNSRVKKGRQWGYSKRTHSILLENIF